MKLSILIFLGLITTVAIKAQTRNQDTLQLYKRYLNPDTYKKLISQDRAEVQSEYNVDNSVLKIPAPILTYSHHVNGLDIYQATPDNMYVVKPDSTFAYNMPVKNFLIQLEPEK